MRVGLTLYNAAVPPFLLTDNLLQSLPRSLQNEPGSSSPQPWQLEQTPAGPFQRPKSMEAPLQGSRRQPKRATRAPGQGGAAALGKQQAGRQACVMLGAQVGGGNSCQST